ASGGALLLNLEVVFTALLARWAFGEPVGRRSWAGLGFLAAGGALLSWSGEAGVLEPGSLWILAATLAWGLDNNLTARIERTDAVLVAGVKGLAGGAVNLALAGTRGEPLLAGVAWPAALVTGALGYGVSLVLFVLGLRRLGAVRTVAWFSLAPFFGAAASVLVLGESLSVRLAGAALLMALGLGLHQSERHRHPHRHGPLVHNHPHLPDPDHRHDHRG
ncbi:DMT family transporter, partial [Deferrisoma palaeochoriense]